MRLLQRYILFELIRVFAFVVSVVTVLLVFVGVFREVSENGLGPLQILQILPFVVPSMLPFTIPATLLLTVCIVYGRMAGDREIIAAKAAGINVLSLLWPAFFLGSVLSVFGLLLTDQVIPWSVANIQQIVTRAMEDIFLDLLRTQNQVVDRGHGLAINVIGVQGKRLIRPTFRYAPPGKSPITIQAREATLEFDLERQLAIVHLINGSIDTAGQTSLFLEEEEYLFPLPNSDEEAKPRHLKIDEIHRQLEEAIQDQADKLDRRNVEAALALAVGDFDRFATTEFRGYGTQIRSEERREHRLRTEMHSRFAMSTSCFFFVLFGSPFAILMGRRQFLDSFLACFLPILLVYYPLVMLSMNLSKTGTANPLWAMWIPNLLMLAAAAIVLHKVLKH